MLYHNCAFIYEDTALYPQLVTHIYAVEVSNRWARPYLFFITSGLLWVQWRDLMMHLCETVSRVLKLNCVILVSVSVINNILYYFCLLKEAFKFSYTVKFYKLKNIYEYNLLGFLGIWEGNTFPKWNITAMLQQWSGEKSGNCSICPLD